MLTMARMRVRLTFPSALIQEPIVYRLVKDFDIVINIYVNQEDIRFLQAQKTTLKDGDEVSIVPAIAGGR